MADGSEHVIIIELKQYSPAPSPCTVTPGPGSTSCLPGPASPGHILGLPNTILNLNENRVGGFDDLFKLTMNVPINILILMESHLEN